MLDPTKPNRDLLLLSPWVKQRVDVGLRMLSDLGFKMAVFEGYRCPQRSDWLYEQGRSRPGKVVTKAKAWASWHNYATAVDLVFFNGKDWDWKQAADYAKPVAVMKSLGFTCGADWADYPHFQIDGGLSTAEAKAIVDQWGMPALWAQIRERIEAKEKVSSALRS